MGWHEDSKLKRVQILTLSGSSLVVTIMFILIKDSFPSFRLSEDSSRPIILRKDSYKGNPMDSDKPIQSSMMQ